MNSKESNKKSFEKNNTSSPTNSNLGKGSKNRDFQNSINEGPKETPFDKGSSGSLLGDESKDENKKGLIDKAVDVAGDAAIDAGAASAGIPQAATGPIKDSEIVDKAKEKAAKKIKRRMVGCGLAAGLALILFVLAIGALIKLVEPITALVEGVVRTAETVVRLAENFLEKTKNLFLHGYFENNEQLLLQKIIDKSKEFQKKYGRALNIPLVSATVYYDGQTGETKTEYRTVIVDGKEQRVPRISNERLDNRLKYLDDIIERMFAIKEYKYRCDYKLMEAGKGSYEMTLVEEKYVMKKDESKEGRPCNENNITGDSKSDDDYIFVYKEVYDEQGYAYKLKNDLMDDGRSLIEHLYPEKYKEVGSVDPIIQDIINYYEVWILIYGKPELTGDCYFPGSLDENVMNSFSPPLKGGYRITSKFGLRSNPFGDSNSPTEAHRGIDLVPTSGDNNIYAVADGVVTINMYDGSAGNFVTIQHQVGENTYYTQYMHMERLSSLTVGQNILKGDIIGKVGSTGRSTGPHLHFGVYTTEGGKDYKDPENLLSGAENYNYECVDPGEELVRSCSVEGAIAMYSLDEKKSFNLIRAILNDEKNRLLMLDFNSEDLSEMYNESKSKYKIYFDNMSIDIDGQLMSFADPFRDYKARTAVVESIGEYNSEVYSKIRIGFSNFSATLYNQYGYTSPKEMFEVFNNNPVEYVKTIFNHAINSDSYVEDIFDTIESTEGAMYTVLSGETKESISNKLGIQSTYLLASGELDSNIKSGNKIRISNRAAITGVLKSIFKNVPETSIFNRYKNDPSYIGKIISNFEGFYNSPSSTSENYVGQCLHVPKPDWEDCITWENKDNCKNNLKTHTAAANYFLKKAPSVAGKKVLAYGLSLWGKVRYCGACDLSNPECNFINPNTGKIGKDAHKYSYSGVRCSPWARSWGKEGFNPKWKELHTYTFSGVPYYKNREDMENNTISYKSGGGTFTAALAGLDCDGYVNWVLNHAFNDFTPNAFPVMSTVCNGETKYTYSTQFQNVEGFTDFGNSILPVLKPGDVICNSTSEKFGTSSQKADPTWNYAGGSRHVMFFMGFEDANGNMVADASDFVYVLHSSTYGVRVDKIPASTEDWLQYSSFASYK